MLLSNFGSFCLKQLHSTQLLFPNLQANCKDRNIDRSVECKGSMTLLNYPDLLQYNHSEQTTRGGKVTSS